MVVQQGMPVLLADKLEWAIVLYAFGFTSVPNSVFHQQRLVWRGKKPAACLQA